VGIDTHSLIPVSSYSTAGWTDMHS
jgi:hypothetical protein